MTIGRQTAFFEPQQPRESTIQVLNRKVSVVWRFNVAMIAMVVVMNFTSISHSQLPQLPQPSQPKQPVRTAKEVVAELRGTKVKKFPPVAADKIVRYTARRVSKPIQVDGKLDEAAWKSATRSTRFVDLVTGGRTIHDTRVAVLWDDEFLYLGYWVEEPNVQAKFVVRDKPIWQDNDVEFFLAFDHAYYELELNAHGTLYEGLFVWQKPYEQHRFFDLPDLDRGSPAIRVQKFNGVGYKQHPRGLRWAFLGWDFPKLQSAVQIQGTLNRAEDRDQGWTVELALPWTGMKAIAHGDPRSIPPRDGDVWRMDFSRFNQYHAPLPACDSGGWALSHHGVWDSHIPEVFPRIVFSQQVVGQASK